MKRIKPTQAVRTSPDAPAVETVPLARLRPAHVNDLIYKPVDPATRALAASIERFGVLDPFLVTEDDVILSGHRRRVACQLAGVEAVPVVRVPFRSTALDFPARLAACNEQRVKTVAEQVREAVARADRGDPEVDAATRLVCQRAVESVDAAELARRSGLCVLPETGARRRADISPAKLPMLAAALAVADDYRAYWPLTLRQIHYRLLTRNVLRNATRPDSKYVNTQQCYKDLSDLLSRARHDGRFPFEAIHDPTRPQQKFRLWDSPRTFIAERLDRLLVGYHRNLLQSQPAYIELVAEKMTVETIVQRAAGQYGLPYTVGRGYTSVSVLNDLADRFRRSGKSRFVLLVASGFDPEGEDITRVVPAALRDEFGVEDLTAVKVALTAGQVRAHHLPPLLTAKDTSSRAPGFVAEHGDAVYELEALEPAALERIVRDAIEGVLDVPAFRAEEERYASDLREIAVVRQQVLAALDGFR